MPSSVKMDPDDLSEVQVTAHTLTQAPAQDIPEIVVTGQRIPWFVWAAGGVLAFIVLEELFSKRRS